VSIGKSPRADRAGSNKYGTKWLKTLYRGYSDSTFTQLTEQPKFQGTQGPIIRSEVGDLVEIMFVNNLTRNYVTMHSMGLAYTKAYGEGGDYPNKIVPGVNVTLDELNSGVAPRQHQGIEPGGCVVYKWMVQDSAGPPPGEPMSILSIFCFIELFMVSLSFTDMSTGPQLSLLRVSRARQ
jgi:hypothetical protein